MARTIDDMAQARAEIERDGLTLRQPVVSPRGEVIGERTVINPAEGALRRAQRRLEALLTQLALTPTARRRLGL